MPSKGPMITRDDLVAFKTKNEVLVSRARALANKRIPKDQLLTQLNAADFGWEFKLDPDDLDRFYAELSSRRMVSEHAGAK